MIYFSSLGDAMAERLRPQQHQTRFVLEDHHGGPEQSIRVVEEVKCVVRQINQLQSKSIVGFVNCVAATDCHRILLFPVKEGPFWDKKL